MRWSEGDRRRRSPLSGIATSSPRAAIAERRGLGLAALLGAAALAGCGNSAAQLIARADSAAAAIDRHVAVFMHDTATVLGPSAEGAFFEAHYQGGALRRLRGSFAHESGASSETTYYFNPSLFLVHRIIVAYDLPDAGRVTDSTSDRVYLDEHRVFAWRSSPRDRALGDSASAARLRDSLEASARRLLERMPRRS